MQLIDLSLPLLSLRMAAARQKERKTKRSSSLCCFGGCFGFSSKVSADHGHGKPQKRGALPVNDDHIPMSLNGEIQVVEEDDDDKKKKSRPADNFSNNIKTDDITSEKNKTINESNPIKSSVIKRTENQNSAARKLSHSVSLPLPRRKKEKAPPPAGVGEKKDKMGNDDVVVGGEFDSIMGAGIIMVILVVMVIWGKICAILCAAACFYVIPRFRAIFYRSYTIKIKNGESDRVDFDSWEYKKKVVLQGLLDRN